jgi:hypothetical protein
MAKKKDDNSQDEQKKKVRKVGRPKKRGRKKKYYKPKSKSKKSVSKKGFSSNVTYNRVRQVLWENHKDDFPNYRAFISNKVDADGKKIAGTSIVSLVFRECKSLECNDEDILSIYRQFREQDQDDSPPLIPTEWYFPMGYWQILTDDFWSGMEERLWIVSPLLTDPDYFLGILGSDIYVNKDNKRITYTEYLKDKEGKIVRGKKWRFKEWVDWCNELQTQKLLEGSDQVPHFRFSGKSDEEDSCYWNPIEKRWEVRIISCTSFGETEDYGFEPLEPDNIDPDVIQGILTKTPTKKEEPTPTSPSGSDKEVELKKAEAEIKRAEAEIERAKAEQEKSKVEELKIQREMAIIDLFAKGKITEQKMDAMLKNLK